MAETKPAMIYACLSSRASCTNVYGFVSARIDTRNARNDNVQLFISVLINLYCWRIVCLQYIPLATEGRERERAVRRFWCDIIRFSIFFIFSFFHFLPCRFGSFRIVISHSDGILCQVYYWIPLNFSYVHTPHRGLFIMKSKIEEEAEVETEDRKTEKVFVLHLSSLNDND